MDPDEAAILETLGDVVSTALTAALVSNLLMQFFLSSALSIVWGALNNLQIIMHLILFDFIFPSNV